MRHLNFSMLFQLIYQFKKLQNLTKNNKMFKLVKLTRDFQIFYAFRINNLTHNY